MTFKVGFTGTQHGMTENQMVGLSVVLKELFVSEAQFHHGNCIGADTEAASMAGAMGYWTVSHPPVNTTKMGTFVSDETRPPKEYIDRNHDIVDECDVLVACPATAHEIIRSGTWATLRYLKRFHPQKQLRFLFPHPVIL